MNPKLQHETDHFLEYAGNYCLPLARNENKEFTEFGIDEVFAGWVLGVQDQNSIIEHLFSFMRSHEEFTTEELEEIMQVIRKGKHLSQEDRANELFEEIGQYCISFEFLFADQDEAIEVERTDEECEKFIRQKMALITHENSYEYFKKNVHKITASKNTIEKMVNIWQGDKSPVEEKRARAVDFLNSIELLEKTMGPTSGTLEEAVMQAKNKVENNPEFRKEILSKIKTMQQVDVNDEKEDQIFTSLLIKRRAMAFYCKVGGFEGIKRYIEPLFNKVQNKEVNTHDFFALPVVLDSGEIVLVTDFYLAFKELAEHGLFGFDKTITKEFLEHSLLKMIAVKAEAIAQDPMHDAEPMVHMKHNKDGDIDFSFCISELKFMLEIYDSIYQQEAKLEECFKYLFL